MIGPQTTAGHEARRPGIIPAPGAGRSPTSGQSNMTDPQVPTADARTDAECADAPRGCTAAQMRRFIKSRPYVPLHELRRRFELNGEADELSCIETSEGSAFVGLPRREAQMLGDLLRQNDVGLEFCKDPPMPVVIGVYPMRPVVRN
jgi:hypothetical protein